MCEETNPVNVIKFVSFVTPSKLKFKNIYKMSKSDRREGKNTNREPGKMKTIHPSIVIAQYQHRASLVENRAENAEWDENYEFIIMIYCP